MWHFKCVYTHHIEGELVELSAVSGSLFDDTLVIHKTFYEVKSEEEQDD